MKLMHIRQLLQREVNKKKGWKKTVALLVIAALLAGTVGQPAYAAKSEAEDDDAYLAELKAAGFPSSYRKKLLELHKLYPKWKFEAVVTGLTWDEVMLEESVNGRNLVHTTADDGMKSTAKGAYNWELDRWTVYDGSSWVAAHSDYIAYVMDPRNFLNETDIFQFENMSYSSAQKKAVVQSIIRGTFMEKTVKDTDGKMLNYADTFMTIAKKSKVSPYLLATRVRQEQGLGNGDLISGNYENYKGFFNYFNFGAFGKTKKEVIINGLKYAKKQGWTSRYKSLLGGAQLLGSNYIAIGQNTLYFQKFNVVYAPSLYMHQYMTNVNAAISEGRNVAKGYANKKQSFVFRIPVYKSMPSKPVEFARVGNPNTYIRNLSIGIEEFDSGFNRLNKEYELTVPYETAEINVEATPASNKSTVEGTGVITLAEGKNTIKVKCISQKGTKRTYKIVITRMSKE